MKHEMPPKPEQEILAGYQPVTLARQRFDGWTAERQRAFLTTLAETGCVSESCRAAGITARSAYRLRAHPSGLAFSAAWDRALRYASGKLVTLAYERAIRGKIREYWRDGKLVVETREPSDKLLMFLLTRIAPSGGEQVDRWVGLRDHAAQAAVVLDSGLADLQDSDVPADELRDSDFEAVPIRPEDARHAPFDHDEGV